jgi:hypothetical protein
VRSILRGPGRSLADLRRCDLVGQHDFVPDHVLMRSRQHLQRLDLHGIGCIGRCASRSVRMMLASTMASNASDLPREDR